MDVYNSTGKFVVFDLEFGNLLALVGCQRPSHGVGFPAYCLFWFFVPLPPFSSPGCSPSGCESLFGLGK